MSTLTVLMPVYNAELHLQAAIDSIVGQSFRDFIFLIIDDGSTDRSAEIIHAVFDSRIRYVRNPRNMGIAKTLNRGIDLSSTELIARMDADDVSHPDRLMKQMNYMRSDPDCAMLSTLTRDLSEDGQVLGENFLQSDEFYFNLTFYCWIYHPSVIYRKSIIQRLGLYPVSFAEDYLLWCRLIREHKFWTLPEYLLDHRTTSQSTCNVVHRGGYAEAELAQVLENLRYFMGEEYTLPREWVECYRNNLDPLWDKRRVGDIVACIRELNSIAARVASKENINCEPAKVRKAAAAKRTRVVRAFAKRLAWPRRFALLTATGSYRILCRLLLQAFRARVRS